MLEQILGGHLFAIGAAPFREERRDRLVEPEPVVVDTTEPAPQLSPVLSRRRWEQEAETNE